MFRGSKLLKTRARRQHCRKAWVSMSYCRSSRITSCPLCETGWGHWIEQNSYALVFLNAKMHDFAVSSVLCLSLYITDSKKPQLKPTLIKIND